MLFSIQDWPDKPEPVCSNLSRFYIWCFAPRIGQVFVGDSGYDKEPLLKRIGNSRKNNVTDCSSVEIGVKRIERDIRGRGRTERGRFPLVSRKYIYPLRTWVSRLLCIYGRLRIALLDKSCTIGFRRDAIWYIVEDAGFFVTRRGRNYETGHFSQTAAGCRNTKSAHPLPAPSPSVPSRLRDNEIYELYTLYEPSDCGSVWSMLPARLSTAGALYRCHSL